MNGINDVTKMLLDKLMDNMKGDGSSKVYNHEIYRGSKKRTVLSQALKYAGDLLEKKSDGWIKRKFDRVGYHYIEVEK